MEDFEKKLSALKPREPSKALDARIATALAAAPSRAPHKTPTPIRLPWAIAAALTMGLVGFAGGRLSAPPEEKAPPTRFVAKAPDPAPVQLQIIYESRFQTNPFDYTTAVDDSLRPSDLRTHRQESGA